MTTRTLALRRETLTELSTGDLVRVAGAGYDASGLTCPLDECLSQLVTCYPSWGRDSGCC